MAVCFFNPVSASACFELSQRFRDSIAKNNRRASCAIAPIPLAAFARPTLGTLSTGGPAAPQRGVQRFYLAAREPNNNCANVHAASFFLSLSLSSTSLFTFVAFLLIYRRSNFRGCQFRADANSTQSTDTPMKTSTHTQLSPTGVWRAELTVNKPFFSPHSGEQRASV